MKLSKQTLYLIIVALVLVGCDRTSSQLSFKNRGDIIRGNKLQRGEAPLNFHSLQKYILKPKCMSCHAGEEAEPKNDPIDFSSFETTMIDRFVPLLIKGKPEKSRLFQTVESGEMPEEGTLLDSEIEFIRKWIQACAPKETQAQIPEDCNSGGSDDDEPGDDEPGDDEPGDDEPGDDEPGDDEPGDDEPGDDEPN